MIISILKFNDYRSPIIAFYLFYRCLYFVCHVSSFGSQTNDILCRQSECGSVECYNMRNVFFMTIWIYTFLGLLWGTVSFFGNSFLVITHAFFPQKGEEGME